MRELNITAREEGQRLDKILSKYLNKAPKSFLYKMLRKKNIKLNGKKATGNEKLSKGDQVCIYLAEDTISKFREEVRAGKQKLKLDILYEDDNVIMVNKPWGILSQDVYKRQVADVVYNPEETRFLREAKEHGCITVPGKGMLLWQGVASFKLFTGKDMPVDEVKERFFQGV